MCALQIQYFSDHDPDWYEFLCHLYVSLCYFKMLFGLVWFDFLYFYLCFPCKIDVHVGMLIMNHDVFFIGKRNLVTCKNDFFFCGGVFQLGFRLVFAKVVCWVVCLVWILMNFISQEYVDELFLALNHCNLFVTVICFNHDAWEGK